MLRSDGVLILACALLCLSAAVPVPSYAADTAVPSVRTVHVDDIDLAYRDFGSGDPLVMIMGYGGSMDLWSPRLLTLLSVSHRVLVFDNRGMGRSTSSDREYTVPLFASDTLGLMNALDFKSAAIVAWSLGTEIALELAITNPSRVKELVLISGTPGGRRKISPRPEVIRAVTDTSGSTMQWGLRLIWVLFPHDWLLTHPVVSSYFPTNATMNPPERTRRQYLAMTGWEGCYDRLGLVTSPTLIITGDQDEVVPPQNSDLLAAGIPASRLVRIPHGGHGIIYQYPERIADQITAFLKEQAQ